MFDKVTIAYRGATYQIGRDRHGYGIWTAAAPGSQPLQRWPETPDGWAAAWARFTELEVPETMVGVAKPPRAASAPGGPAIAAALLGAGVALGVAGLFPAYLDGASLASQPFQLVAHVIYLAAWTASAALILAGGARRQAGALLGTGVSAVTSGLFLADLGTVIAGGAHLAGAGLALSLAGWLCCAAGSAAGLLVDRDGALSTARPAVLARPRGPGIGPAVLLVLAGLGAAAAFAPSWDSYTLRIAAGQARYITAGNAFANPAPVIAGDVVVMIALAAAVVVAALWRPARQGAALLAGAIIPMAAQAISALVQVGEGTSPAQFGISPAQASQLGLTVSSGVTPAFWIYCAFLIVLAVCCAWMLLIPDRVPLAAPVCQNEPVYQNEPIYPDEQWRPASDTAGPMPLKSGEDARSKG